MIITNNMLDKNVPKNMIPTRLDSALTLLVNVDWQGESGILTYNINPETWNCLYPFYASSHKFTIDSYIFKNEDITYGELIAEYRKTYEQIYEQEYGQRKQVRIDNLVNELKETFRIDQVEISDELTPVFELKFSKSKNVWTLYYFENYLAEKVDSLETLLSQKVYQQKILPLDPEIREIDGIEVASNVPYIFSIEDNLKKLNNNLMVLE